jgi:hypothetical protein
MGAYTYSCTHQLSLKKKKKNVPISFQRNFASIEKSQEQESFLLAQKYYLLKMQEKY